MDAPLDHLRETLPHNSLRFTAALLKAHLRSPQHPIGSLARHLPCNSSAHASLMGTNCVGSARALRERLRLPTFYAPLRPPSGFVLPRPLISHGAPCFFFEKRGDSQDRGVCLFELPMAADVGPVVVRRGEPTFIEGTRRIDDTPFRITYHFDGDHAVWHEYWVRNVLRTCGHYLLAHCQNPDASMTRPLAVREPNLLVLRRGKRDSRGGPEIHLNLWKERATVKWRDQPPLSFSLQDRDRWEVLLPGLARGLRIPLPLLRGQVTAVAGGQAESGRAALRRLQSNPEVTASA